MIEARTILLVEDDPRDLELTLTALRTIGANARVRIASSGEEALDFLYRRGKFDGYEESQPALVLLDVKLPLVSGLELLRTVKTDASLQSIPVVMLTSSPEESDVDDSYRLGANGYVVKPLEFEAYVASVTRICAYWLELNHLPTICSG
jgi:CheY-like chemotaxis protein